MAITLQRRPLGSTGLHVSVLGLGGFHQGEIGQADVSGLVDTYLAAGGNYIETARSYGGGVAERKLGVALEGRRGQVILATKTGRRDAEGAWREINASLEALRTDHLDLLFYHGVNEPAEVEAIAGPGGAGEAVARARAEGLVRFVGASTHWPLTLLAAMDALHLDVAMYWVNYLAACNYPELYRSVAPAARARGLGIVGMKPLGDGYLYRSVGPAFTYALAQEVDVLACGFNSPEMLVADLEAVAAWERPSAGRWRAFCARPRNWAITSAGSVASAACPRWTCRGCSSWRASSTSRCSTAGPRRWPNMCCANGCATGSATRGGPAPPTRRWPAPWRRCWPPEAHCPPAPTASTCATS
jgi:aryl-alcohol dehydrogenase-like predicted oxidoreductase